MSDSSNVILQTLDAGFFKAPPKAHPSCAYVVSYKDGTVRSFPGAPPASARRGGQYCYIIDTAEHRAAGQCAVPSSVDAYSFTVEMNARWKVTDAEAIVRENVSDGSAAVLDWLKDQLWQVARQFLPEQAGLAEAEARSALQVARPLSQGITVLAAAARFRGDSRLTDGRVALDTDSLQGQIDQQRHTRLKQRLDGGDGSAVLEHLLQHPEDTGTVLAMMASGRERNQTLQLGILKELLDKGLITDADAQPLRDAVLGGPQLTQTTSAAQATLGWSKPTLALPSGVTLQSGPAAVGPAGNAAQVPVTPDDDDDVDADPVPVRLPRTPAAAAPAPAPAAAPGANTGSPAGSSPGGVVGWKSLVKRPQGGQ